MTVSPPAFELETRLDRVWESTRPASPLGAPDSRSLNNLRYTPPSYLYRVQVPLVRRLVSTDRFPIVGSCSHRDRPRPSLACPRSLCLLDSLINRRPLPDLLFASHDPHPDSGQNGKPLVRPRGRPSPPEQRTAADRATLSDHHHQLAAILGSVLRESTSSLMASAALVRPPKLRTYCSGRERR